MITSQESLTRFDYALQPLSTHVPPTPVRHGREELGCKHEISRALPYQFQHPYVYQTHGSPQFHNDKLNTGILQSDFFTSSHRLITSRQMHSSCPPRTSRSNRNHSVLASPSKVTQIPPIIRGRQPSTYGPRASKRTSASTFSPHSNAFATSTPLDWSISSSGYISITHESESNSLLPSLIDLNDSINNEQTRIHVFTGQSRELSATAAGSEGGAGTGMKGSRRKAWGTKELSDPYYDFLNI
jgi:hypothetical protein